MVEGFGLKESLPPRDRVSGFPGIRFEPGAHEGKREKYAELYTSLVRDKKLEGTHMWKTTALMVRIKQYHPSILAIDGQNPSREGKLDEYEKAWAWIGLPGSPKDIHPQDKTVFVVRGDPVFLEETFRSQADLTSNQIKTWLRTYEKKEGWQRDLTADTLEAGVPCLALIGLALVDADTTAKRQKELSRTTGTKPTTLTRRDFLIKGGGIVAGALTTHPLMRWIATLSAPHVKNEPIKEQLLKFISLMRSRFDQENWINVRTAVLIQKMADSYETLKLPPTEPGAIIMGVWHANEATLMMNDEKYRKQIIARGAKNLIEAFNEAFGKTFAQKRIPIQEFCQALLDRIARTEIVKATSPEDFDRRYDPQAPSIVNKLVEPVICFQSPGVEEALKELR